MLKLSRQGFMKFDEKAFEKQFMESVRMAPVAFTTAAYDKLITRWTENTQTELRRRSESAKENSELSERRKNQAVKLAQLDSLRGVTSMRMTGQSLWTTVTVPKDEGEKTSRANGGYRIAPSVSSNGHLPSVYYEYATEETAPRRRTSADVIGPQEETAVAPKPSGTYFRQPVRTTAQGGTTQGQGTSTPKQISGTHLKTLNGTKAVIIDGKIVEVREENGKERKVLRVESF
jgi:hypothetical protein